MVDGSPETRHGGFEYGVQHARIYSEPHRWGMTEAEALEWIAEWDAMGGTPGTFYVIRREVGPWKPVAVSRAHAALAGRADTEAGEPCSNCDGRGRYEGWPHTSCPVCEGAGRADTEATKE